MGSFKAFVEIGRVCVISHGKEFGKLVVIADVVDQNRVRMPKRAREDEGRRHRESEGAGSRLSLARAAGATDRSAAPARAGTVHRMAPGRLLRRRSGAQQPWGGRRSDRSEA